MPVIINGTTGLSGVSTVNLANGSVTQNILANGVAGTGPAFSAFSSITQAIANGTATKIAFNVEEYDTANCFDSVTNYRFTPNVAGYYSVAAEVAIPGGNYVYPAIYKNGSLYKNGVLGAVTNAPYVSNVACHVFLNGTTDYIEVYALQSSGSTQNTAPSSNGTFFQACLMRAA